VWSRTEQPDRRKRDHNRPGQADEIDLSDVELISQPTGRSQCGSPTRAVKRCGDESSPPERFGFPCDFSHCITSVFYVYDS
jgi:hypothetical protein